MCAYFSAFVTRVCKNREHRQIRHAWCGAICWRSHFWIDWLRLVWARSWWLRGGHGGIVILHFAHRKDECSHGRSFPEHIWDNHVKGGLHGALLWGHKGQHYWNAWYNAAWQRARQGTLQGYELAIKSCHRLQIKIEDAPTKIYSETRHWVHANASKWSRLKTWAKLNGFWHGLHKHAKIGRRIEGCNQISRLVVPSQGPEIYQMSDISRDFLQLLHLCCFLY